MCLGYRVVCELGVLVFGCVFWEVCVCDFIVILGEYCY